jgi:hypothetical protein
MEKSFVDDEPSTKNRKIEMFHANTDTESKNRILEEFTKADSNIKVYGAHIYNNFLSWCFKVLK